MRIRKATATLTTVLAASALALTACGDDSGEDSNGDDSSTVEETEESEETEEPTEEASEEATEADSDAAPADATAPGTELAIGDSATVPFSYGEGNGVIEVVVDEIVEGTPADLEPLDLGDQATGMVPYYINFTVTGVSGSDTLSHASVDGEIEGLLADGSDASSLSVIGDWEPCNDETAPDDFADGASFSSCSPYLAPAGAEVTSAQFADDGDYNSVDGSPIVWK